MAHLFDLPQELMPLNGMMAKSTVTQMLPYSTSPAGSFVGSNNASTTTTFQWKDTDWWIPSQSYFFLEVAITKNAGAPALTDYVAYVDNPACTLFQNITTQIDNVTLDTMVNPAQIDAALTRANTTKNFNDTYNSAARVGEGFQTRLINTCANGGVLQIAFRPPVAMFNIPVAPPGAMMRIDFQWMGNAINFFESLAGDISIGVGSNQFQVKINQFLMYKSCISPSPNVRLPAGGFIEVQPSACQQLTMNGNTVLNQPITLNPTTNRILIGLQDLCSVATSGVTPGVGYGGYNPATYFSNTFADNATNTPNTVRLTSAFVQLTELNIQVPQQTYMFGTNGGDWMRAYNDFIAYTQGSARGIEGSIPFGTNQTTGGVAIQFVDTAAIASTVLQAGNPKNDDPVIIANVSGTTTLSPAPLGIATTVSTTTFNKKARYGYMGNYPLLAIPVVRPGNKALSTAQVQLQFSAAVSAVAIQVITTYSVYLKLTRGEGNMYHYQIVTGI